MFSPITFFAYNRPYQTSLSLEALSKNKESKESDLIVFIDGPKSPSQKHLINYVENIVLSFNGSFNSLTIYKSDINMGGAASQRSGITKVLEKYEKVIVIEDDILVSPYFLKYMNEALNIYINNEKVWHINGFNFPLKFNNKDCYFSSVMFCWGWATWKNRWFKHIKDPLYHDPFFLRSLFDRKMKKKFNLDTQTNFFWSQIESNLRGKVTWDIFWYCYIYLNKGLCLTPEFSLTRNIGHDGSGVHSRAEESIQNSQINNNPIVNFPKIVIENKLYRKEMAKYLTKTYSKKAKIIRLFKRKPSIKVILKIAKDYLI